VPSFSLAELSAALNVSYEGDGTVKVTGLAEINKAQEGELSFVANPKYVPLISQSKAAVLIVPIDLETDFRPVLRSPNPYLTFTNALNLFHANQRKTSGGIHPSAHIANDVILGNDITIMAHAVIESGSQIEEGVVIYPGCYIGQNVIIQEESTLYANVSIYHHCQIGKRTILHAGCRIGSSIKQIPNPQRNPVLLEDDIELGANVVVAGDYEHPTRIGNGTKVDNLVQVGKGTSIGEHCIIVAQVTLGDHVTFGERVTIAGQVVISSGVSIGNRSRVGAKSVVETDIPDDADYWGVPARPHRDEKRLKASLARLPKYFKRIQEIENEL
jgi:UDP-3-O-[3-hydroxymyristoyl] glucosamine N-acyltransferase